MLVDSRISENVALKAKSEQQELRTNRYCHTDVERQPPTYNLSTQKAIMQLVVSGPIAQYQNTAQPCRKLSQKHVHSYNIQAHESSM